MANFHAFLSLGSLIYGVVSRNARLLLRSGILILPFLLYGIATQGKMSCLISAGEAIVPLKRLAMFAIWGLLILAGIFFLVRFIGLMDYILPAGTPPKITFGRDADLPKTHNFFLACPADQLPSTNRAMQSPTFKASVAALTEVLIDTAEDHGMQRMRDVSAGEPDRLYFLARSSVFRFPDWVVIDLIRSEKGGDVTFCLFAKSVYGTYDLGKNEKRTRAWLSDLMTRLDQDQ